jgi:hypothetical protein
MNRQGIALASDTSITISGRTAIFENGVKIFSLGDNHNIGSMHFGDTTVLGVSDEVFMTFFQDYLNANAISIDSMEDVANELVHYLESNDSFLRLKEDEEVSVLRKLHRMIKGDLFKAIDIAKDENLSRQETVERFVAILGELLENQCTIDGDQHLEYVYDTYHPVMTELLEAYVNVTFTEQQLNTLHLSLTKGICAIPSEHLTILFTGFCDHDLFPSSIELHIYGYYNGKIQYEMLNHKQISESIDNQVHTNCFGECDVIYSFKHDVDQTVQANYFELVHKDVFSYINDLDDRIMDMDDKQELYERLLKALQETMGYMEYKIEEKVDSIEHILSKISADDLVAYSENMVNIAKVKSLYTLNKDTQGTVTGDIVSAKITVYNGFEWSRQKEGKQ